MMFTTTLLLATLAAGPLPPQQPDAFRAATAHLDRALDLLLAEGASSDEMKAGFLALLDAMAETAPPSSGPGGTCGARFAVARLRMGDGSILDEAGVSLLAECYRETHDGRAFAVPGTVRSVADARQHVRRQIESAQTLLREGRSREAVAVLLDATMLIVTPMER